MQDVMFLTVPHAALCCLRQCHRVGSVSWRDVVMLCDIVMCLRGPPMPHAALCCLRLCLCVRVGSKCWRDVVMLSI